MATGGSTEGSATGRGQSREDEIREECLEQVHRLAYSWVTFTPAGTLLLAGIMGDSVPLSRRLLWAGFVMAASAVMAASSWRFLSLRRAGRPAGNGVPSLVGHALLGTAWGSISLFAFPGPEHTDLRAVIILFAAITSMLGAVATAAAGPRFFLAVQVPLITPMGLVVGMTDERLNRYLGIAIPLYFAIVAALHRGLHRLMLSELHLKHHNAALVESLTAEQERTEHANLRLRSANDRLSNQATRDHLTGLANRAAFQDALDRAVAGSHRHNHLVAVLYFDLDHFKVVNDSLGHRAGDELLVAVAGRLLPLLRPEDVLARLGGDEFTVLVAHLQDPLEAMHLAERLRAALAEPFAISGRRIEITSSIGVATSLHTGSVADDLLAHADSAQYRAKQAGRNRVEVFDIALRDSLLRRLSEEAALRAALTAGEIVPYFQPQVDLSTGAIIGAEALARWQHPTRGVLDAGSFITVAEECGLVEDLDTAVVAAAIRARIELDRRGIDPAFRVWLNISPRQLASPEPGRRFREFLEAQDADPSWFGIEITETAILSDTGIAAAQLAAVRELGVKVALDDFGTGHSSLTLLRELPLDEIKIDRSFVAEVLESPTAGAIVAAVVDLARTLRLRVVAEGVETASQARHLFALGAHSGQGWLWSKALPSDDLIRSGFAPAARRRGPDRDAAPATRPA